MSVDENNESNKPECSIQNPKSEDNEVPNMERKNSPEMKDENTKSRAAAAVYFQTNSNQINNCSVYFVQDQNQASHSYAQVLIHIFSDIP